MEEPQRQPAEDAPDPDDQSSEPRFPIIMLAAPATILVLFTAMMNPLASSLKSVELAIGVGLAATVGAIACFAVISVKCEERPIQIGAAVGIGAALYVLVTSLLQFV